MGIDVTALASVHPTSGIGISVSVSTSADQTISVLTQPSLEKSTYCGVSTYRHWCIGFVSNHQRIEVSQYRQTSIDKSTRWLIDVSMHQHIVASVFRQYIDMTPVAAGVLASIMYSVHFVAVACTLRGSCMQQGDLLSSLHGKTIELWVASLCITKQWKLWVASMRAVREE